MALGSEFIRIADTYFDPARTGSGMENSGWLLYALVRMSRPRTIVEYGTGYNTLFMLRALADNIEDRRHEYSALLNKTRDSRILDTFIQPRSVAEAVGKPSESAVNGWLRSGGRAAWANPKFYLQSYEPRLYSFQRHGPENALARQARHAIEAVGHAALFAPLWEQPLRKHALPEGALPIGVAWNALGAYREFFSEFWNQLSPTGGMMVFHNVPAYEELYADIQWMREQRRSLGDLEVVILQEPHKLYQNGCAVLRRSSEYRPRFATWRMSEVMDQLRELMSRVEI